MQLGKNQENFTTLKYVSIFEKAKLSFCEKSCRICSLALKNKK